MNKFETIHITILITCIIGLVYGAIIGDLNAIELTKELINNLK